MESPHGHRRVEAKSEFEWKSGGASLGTRAMHTWTFTAGQGGTLVTTDESMTGWLVSLLKVIMPTFLDKSLDVWLRDLKTQCESLA